jgi:hypothetical protein
MCGEVGSREQLAGQNRPARGGVYLMTPKLGGPTMLRRILLVLLTALLGLTGWADAAGSAYAGGPTSVLLVNTGRARVHALYLTDTAYDRLAAAVGETAGASTPPPGVGGGSKDEVKLTWLIHDVTVWRLDRVVLTRNDGIWIETALMLPEDDDTGRWHRAHDDQSLTALLSAAGLLGEQAKPIGDSSASTTPAVANGTSAAATVAAPGRPILGIVAAGLGGLVVGALGALVLRPRSTRAPRVTLSG